MEIKVNKIIKSKRRTIALEISKNAELIVRVPRTTTLREIQELINKNSDWISKKLVIAQSKIQQVQQIDYIAGDKIELLGELFQIQFLVYQGKFSKAKIDFNSKTIYLNNGFESENPRNFRKEQLIKLLKKEANRIFLNRMNEIATITNFQFKSLKVTSSQSRWGSCSVDNKINLTWRLILAKPHHLDYVIIHELAHTIQKDHSSKFWNLVAIHFPNYKETMNEFKEYGHLYNIN